MNMNEESNENRRENPFSRPFDAEYGAVPFDKIRLSDYEEAIKEGIRLHQEEIDAIASNPEPPTFSNTIAALDASGRQLSEAYLTLGNLEAALGEPEIMEIMAKVTPLVSEHGTNTLLNAGLWERIRNLYERREELTDLTAEERRMLRETYLDYALSGADLKGEERESLKRNNAELSELTMMFGQNVAREMMNPELRLWLRKEELSGLPETYVSAARQAAADTLRREGKEDDGESYLFTMFAPSFMPFMKYADNRELRERLWRMYGKRNTSGEFDNIKLIRGIVNKRLAKARLLGKESYADMALECKMAANPANVMKLLSDLRESYAAPMRAELAELETFARAAEGPGFRLMPWDYSYWANKLKSSRYAFSDEDMKPYFELENTIGGVFGLATRLYGYTFKENKTVPVYHPDVRVFEVRQADGTMLGLLYADFYYRDGKSPGAWMTEFRVADRQAEGRRRLPLISIVCNFSRPVGEEPVLLTPGEVRTFLHEFGHALHGLSSQVEYAMLSGTNVYHDFVELFSQFNENYLTEKEYLDGFARHYQTGEPMPADLIERFVASGQFGAAYACMRQLGFGYLDMAYHTLTAPLPDEADIERFEKEAQDPVRVFEAEPGCVTSSSFGHIFSGGYAAGYYGYKWSEVLDADAFSAFKEKGIFDPATAAAFRKMLEAGGTVDPMELYVEFRGKKPTVDALLHRDGIA